MVTLHELAHRLLAHVPAVGAANHVPKYSLAHGAIGQRHVFDAKLLENGVHDGKAAWQYGDAVVPQTGQCHAVQMPRLKQRGAQPLHSLSVKVADTPAVGAR